MLSPYCQSASCCSRVIGPEHAADAGAAGKQVRRLALDDLEVLRFGQVDVAVLRQLIDLAFDDPQRHVTEQADDREIVLRERQRHRLQIQEVAEQHRDVIAPARVHGFAPAPQLRLVDDVVVNQRGRVNELEDGGVEHRALARVAGHASGHQQNGRADPLPAAVPDVVTDRRDEGDLRLHVPGELTLDLTKVVANRLEQLREGGG